MVADSSILALGGWQNGALTSGRDDRASSDGAVNANAGFVLTVTFTRDGSTVVTGGTDGTVRLWDADTMKQIGANLPHADNEATVAMAVNADQLLVVSAVGKLHGGI